MARLESKVLMGYLPIEERHSSALFSLLHPATPDHKLLDPMTGSGEFLAAAAKAWNVTPYANELDNRRVKFRYLRHSLEVAQLGAVVM